MSTQITNKQVKIVSDVNFNEKEIVNAIIDATKNNIKNIEGINKVDDVQVNGTSIVSNKVADIKLKTVNGNNINGEGNIVIKTYQAFNANWTVNNTTEQLCDDINDDTNAIPGNAYLGILRTSDLPNEMIQADAVVEIIGESGSSKVIHITITSADQYPYRWEYSYFNNQSIYGWIGFQPELPDQTGQSGKFLTTNGTNLSWGTPQGGGGSYTAGGGLYINNNEIGMNRNTAFYNHLYINAKDDNILESDIQFDMNTFYTYTGGADNNFYNFIYMNGAWNLRIMDYSRDPQQDPWDYIGVVDLTNYGITYLGTPFENGWFILAGNYLTGKTNFTVVRLSFSNVFLNGILLTEGLDFTRNDNTITFINYTLKDTDRIQVI